MDEKLYENASVYVILYKTLIGAKPLRIRFDKVVGFIRAYDRARYSALFGPKNMMPFTIKLDILQTKKMVLYTLFFTKEAS